MEPPRPSWRPNAVPATTRGEGQHGRASLLNSLRYQSVSPPNSTEMVLQSPCTQMTAKAIQSPK